MITISIMRKHLSWIMFVMLVLAAGRIDALESQALPSGLVVASLNADDTLCIVNTQNGGPQWFLLSPSGNTSLGPIFAAFGFIDNAKASPDGRHLAVVSVGGGHRILEIVDLPHLLRSKEFHVLQKLDAYPGNIQLEAWHGSQVHIKSDMLLTARDEKTGQLSPDLSLSWMETFAFNPLTGAVSGVSDGAKNPAEHYAEVLLNASASDSEKDVALTKLLSLHAGELTESYLLKILDQETDPKRMNMILDMLNKLRQ